MCEVPSQFEEVRGRTLNFSRWYGERDGGLIWEAIYEKWNAAFPGFGGVRHFPGADNIIECTDYRRIPDEER